MLIDSLIYISLIIVASEALGPLRDDYKVWCVGNCDHDVATTTIPGAVLMGGGVSAYCLLLLNN